MERTGQEKRLKVVAKKKAKSVVKKPTKMTRLGTYARYILKALKQLSPRLKITNKATRIVNSFVKDIVEKIVGEAGRVAKKDNRRTMTMKDIETALDKLSETG